MKFRSAILLFILALSLSGFNCLAQKIIPAGKEVNFTTYGIEDGLNIPNVSSIYQDSKGYIWVVSLQGTAKFDGIDFKEYGEQQGLPTGGAAAVCEDNDGNMWFATKRGMVVLKNNKFFIDTSRGMPTKLSWDLFKDNDGTIWCANHEGVFHFDPSRFGKRFIKSYLIADKKANNAFRNIFRNKKGDLIAGAETGCYIMKSDSLVRYIPDGVPTYAVIQFDDGREWFSGWGANLYQYKNGKLDTVFNLGSMVLDMTKDRDGNVFLSTWEKGVFKYDGKNFINYSAKQGLGFNSFWSNYCDREGNVWFGSWGAGLFKYSSELFTRISEKTGLHNNIVNGIGQSDDGTIWMSSGTGITSYNPETLETKIYDKFTKSNLPLPKIMCMCVAPNNEVWAFGYAGDGFKIIKNEVIPAPDLGGFGALRDSKNRIWVASEGGAYVYTDGKKSDIIKVTNQENVNNLGGVYEDLDGNIWMYNHSRGINLYTPTKNLDGSIGYKGFNLSKKEGLKNRRATAIVQFKAFSYFIAISGKGIFTCRYHNGKMQILDSLTHENGLISNDVTSLKIFNNMLYVGTPLGVSVMRVNDFIQGKKIIRNYSTEDGLIGKECKVEFQDKDGLIWIRSNKGAYILNPDLNFKNDKEAITNITAIKLFFEEQDFTPYCKGYSRNLPLKLNLPYFKNHLTFSFIGINHTAPEKVKYQYKLVGLDKQWTPINSNREATYSSIPPGTYTFMVKAGNNDGIWNKEPAQYAFSIYPPFWKTKWFYTLCAFTFFGGLYAFVKWREKKHKKERVMLEKKVDERTHQLKSAFEEIEEKNKEITDSINYSKRIQHAILPDENEIAKDLHEYFILFKPKDIVSGDFYYYQKLEEGCIIALVDCTGHGVPGAFMSLVGKENLDKAIDISSKPGKILELLNNGVKKSLRQNHADSTKDGMDIALCYISKTKITYSGANRPVWMIKKNLKEVEEIKAVKVSIAGFTPDNQPFVEHELNVTKGDMIYIFSDGYPDQFGGEKEKKLTTKTFKQLLITCSIMNAVDQKIYLEDYMKNWRKNTEQIDDICVIGIRI